jgi:hypothetical protein
MKSDTASRLVRAWLVTGFTDAIFSSVLVTVFYHSTVARLWQGVASVLLGKEALTGGTKTALIGLRALRTFHLARDVARGHPAIRPSPADDQLSLVGSILRTHSLRRHPDCGDHIASLFAALRAETL